MRPLPYLRLAFFGLSLCWSALSFGYSQQQATLELHAHLFMKEGMGWMMSGDFFGEIEAQDWKSRFGNQTNPQTLNSSQIGLVVATLYAHPLFTRSLKESIR